MKKTASIMGFSKDEMMEHGLVAEFICAEFPDSVQRVLCNSLQNENTSNFKFPLYTKDGAHGGASLCI